MTIYTPAGWRLGATLPEAAARLGMTPDTLQRYLVPSVVPGCRRMARWPLPTGQRGPDRAPRRPRPPVWWKEFA